MKKFHYSFTSPELLQTGFVWAAEAIQASGIVLRHLLAQGFQAAGKISVEPC